MSVENTTTASVKREITTRKGAGLGVSDLVLVAVLLAAGVVLKLTIGSVVNFFGMKPNFIIAAYCLAILLIRPKIGQALVIGLLAGAVCQFLPGTPYLNFISEALGATVMGLLVLVPMSVKKFDLHPLLATFISTIVSGAAFVVSLFLFVGAEISSLVAYVPIVLLTACINAILVQILYVPLKAALKR